MFAAVALALVGSAVAAPVARDATSSSAAAAPSSWATGYLEPYDTYHTRYLALDCQDQHNTTFFDDCCHPLLASQTLKADRPAYCVPNATQISSASEYEATATATASEDTDAESQFATATASLESVWSSVAAATSTSAVAEAKVAAATPTTSTAAPAQTSDSSSDNNNNGGGQVMTGGFATFFYQGGNPGACGNYHSDSDKIIAIDANGWWPDYNSGGPSDLCGRWITITNTNNGKTVTAEVQDVCPTCDTNNSLDLSVGAFTAIASEADGQVPITWTWA